MRADGHPLIKRVAVTFLFLATTSASLFAYSPPDIACSYNLRKISSAVEMWAIMNQLPQTNTYSITDTNIIEYISGEFPMCPLNGKYTAGKNIASEPACSIHGTSSEILRENQARPRRNKIRNIILIITGVSIVGASISVFVRLSRKAVTPE